MPRKFFITSSGTNIGKTLVTTSLCWQLRQQGKTVTALKPVISGYNPEDQQSDTALLLKSCGLTPTPALMETISPWRYAAPLAPAMASAKEGNPVDLDALVAFCHGQAALMPDVLLVEGIGGIMTPLNDRHTVLDWMVALGWPVIVVTGSYLGSISHTLSTLEVLKTRALAVQAVVISESEDNPVPLDDTALLLKKFLQDHIPIVKIPRISTKEGIWKHAPSISWLC